MKSEESVAQAELGRIRRELESIRFRMIGVHTSLPEDPAELVALLDLEDMGTSTHMRAIIETVLRDKIDPAIRDLLALTEHPEEG